MANELICVSCRCGEEASAVLAKEWGGEIGDTSEAWPKAAEQIERFLGAHAGCPISGFYLSREDGSPLDGGR